MSYAKGLEGVVVDETKVSNVEGEIGRLTYRGYPIEALVSQDYVTVMWLVLFGDLPSEWTTSEFGDISFVARCVV